jgi:hypothetical protein
LRPRLALPFGVALFVACAACTDLSDYSTTGNQQYVGCVVGAGFVLSGVPTTEQMCLTFDATQLQTGPGTITTNDGLFSQTPLRPIPQVWNDPLSTLNFGEGRNKNLLYMAHPAGEAGAGGDITVVLSLMQSGGVEVRLLRGAPPLPGGSADASAPNVFAVFPLTLHHDGCARLSTAACAPDAQ